MDLDRIRSETPGCAGRIHLNNAGASLMPQPVLDAVHGHLELEAAIGGYEAHDARTEAIAAAYQEVEGLLGAQKGTIAFVENATVAVAQALSAFAFRSGDLILTTRHDYVSNQLMYLSLRERFGVRIERVPDGAEGGVDVSRMLEAIRDRRPRLVAMSQIPTSSGLVQDAAAVGRGCREAGIPFLLDACQSVGQMPVDVEAIPCTFLAATARKFLRGPRGSGFLYVDPAAVEEGLAPLFPDLRGAEWVGADLARPAPGARRFENWEFAWSLVLGTGAAAHYARRVGLEGVRDRSWGLADRLREILARIPGVRVLDEGRPLCAIVTVAVEGPRPGELVTRLREHGVNTSSVSRSSAVLDFDERGIDAALRFSPHYFNTEEELETAANTLAELLATA